MSDELSYILGLPNLQQDKEAGLVLVQSTTFVWLANPIVFPVEMDISQILGNTIFPYFVKGDPKKMFDSLNLLKRCENENDDDYQKRQAKQMENTDVDLELFTSMLDPQLSNRSHTQLQIGCGYVQTLPGLLWFDHDYTSEYDLFSVIGEQMYKKNAFTAKGKENLSDRFRSYLGQAYSRVSRAPHLIQTDLKWLPELWSQLKGIISDNLHFDQMTDDDVPNEWREFLFADDFTMEIKHLVYYGEMCRYLSKFRGSLLDIWFLYTLIQARKKRLSLLCSSQVPQHRKDARQMLVRQNQVLYPTDFTKHQDLGEDEPSDPDEIDKDKTVLRPSSLLIPFDTNKSNVARLPERPTTPNSPVRFRRRNRQLTSSKNRRLESDELDMEDDRKPAAVKTSSNHCKNTRQ